MNDHLLSSLGTETLLEILKQSDDATAIYMGEHLKINLANNAMLKIWGKDQSVIGKNFEEALPEMIGQPSTKLLKMYGTPKKSTRLGKCLRPWS